MIGLAISLSIGNQSYVGTVTPTTPTATVTMTQLASASRVYQRSTSTGGGQSKGQGTIPTAFSAVTQAGTLHARCSSGGGTRGDLQAEWAAATIGSTGAQTVNITGVDARLGWFYLDILDSSGTWQNGTVLVGMGRVIGLAGQSLAARLIKVMDAAQAGITNASLGVTINSNSVVYATYIENNNNATPLWQTPADSSIYDSTGCAEYLNRVVIASGVNCALASHTHGATSITSWVGAGSDVTNLQSILTAVGGFEAFIWFQGHSDGAGGMSSATYQSDLSTLFTWLATNNGVKGSSFEKYLCSIPNVGNTNWGNPQQVTVIRQAARDWCGSNGAVSVEPSNVDELVDTTHETQAGAIVLARHFYRASRPSLGLSNGDLAATPTATISGATITLSLSGAGTLTSVGTPGNRFSVSTKNGHAKMPITSVTPGANSVAIVLTNTPAANDPLDIHWDYPLAPSAAGNADMLYDGITDSDGITPGRPFRPTYAAPIQIAAPSPSLGPTLTSHSVTYTTGASGYGTMMNGGYASASTALGDDVIPYSINKTIDVFFTLAATPGSTVVLYSGGGLYMSVTSAGKLNADLNGFSITGTTTVSGGTRYHLRLAIDEISGCFMYLNGALEASTATIHLPATGSATFNLGALNGSFIWTGTLDEFATYSKSKVGTFTPPTTPLTGSETDLYALYHLNSVLTSG